MFRKKCNVSFCFGNSHNMFNLSKINNRLVPHVSRYYAKATPVVDTEARHATMLQEAEKQKREYIRKIASTVPVETYIHFTYSHM